MIFDILFAVFILVLKLSLTSQHTTEPLAGSCQLEDKECEKIMIMKYFIYIYMYLFILTKKISTISRLLECSVI